MCNTKQNAYKKKMKAKSVKNHDAPRLVYDDNLGPKLHLSFVYAAHITQDRNSHSIFKADKQMRAMNRDFVAFCGMAIKTSTRQMMKLVNKIDNMENARVL